MAGPNPQFNTDAFVPDRLIAGDKKLVTDAVTLLTGQNIARGALLGKITASGKYIVSLNAAIDGSQVARAIATDVCDATAADKLCGVYLQGEFDSGEVTFGAGQTAANTLDDLAGFGIIWKTSVPA